ncbi:aminodeoxychorismate lyase [Microbacterium sp. R86528]|uniref:aminodeoxychorismate lyase n=1 Tax=Microbacterium sp. R86528 TaxID=3093864 RepID=UPI0037C7A5F7
MTWHFALVIEPAASDSSQTVFADTFTVIDPAAPALSVGELSTQRGDGIFESVGVVDGHPQEVDAHLDRLAHSAKICDLPAPHREQWRQAVTTAAEHTPRRGEGVIKLILSRGVEHGPAPTAWVTSGSAPDFALARAHGVRVVTLDRGYGLDVPSRAPWLLLGAKTLSYAVNMAALREAKRRGADDAIFVTSDGFVLEAPTASLVLRVDGRFVTPAPNGGILHGTTQLSLFEHLEAQGLHTAYEVVPVSLMAEADAAWLLSSVRLAAPITSIDGKDVPVDRELTASINEYLLSPRD